MHSVAPGCFRPIISAGVIFVSLLSPLGAPAQTLANPGLEAPYDSATATGVSGVIANGWSDNTSWASGINVIYSQETNAANVHSGASSQKIQVNAGFVQFVQWLNFQAGRTTASVWLKSPSPLWATLSLRMGASPYTIYSQIPMRLTNGWQLVTVSGVTEAVGGGLFINSVATGTLWVDDASLVFQGNAPEAPQTLAPTNAPIPAVYFGLHPSHLAGFQPPYLPWPNLTFGTVRALNCAPFWANLEPNPPVNGVHTYNWSGLDTFINSAQTHGAQIIYTLYQTPTWASSTNALDPYYYPGGSGCPTNFNDYSNFVHAAAARYQGRIFAYETWNEPDLSTWLGTPAQMATMEKFCAGAVRSADTNALVLAAPPSGGLYPNLFYWYESYLAAGGGTYADVLPLHMYDATPEQDIPHYAIFRSLVAAYGLANKPTWNDETGWGLGTGDTTPMSETVNYVARAYVLDWAVGLPRFCWYLWNETANVGVRTNSTGQWVVPTPGAIAYQQTENWLVGATMTACASDTNGTWTCQITRPNGYTGRIVWAPNQTNNYQLPVSVLRSRDLAGNVTSLVGVTNISVNDTPVLLESSALNLSGQLTANQNFVLELQGLPAAHYTLETTASLQSPATWTATATNQTDNSGALAFTNPVARPAAYFRCRYVP